MLTGRSSRRSSCWIRSDRVGQSARTAVLAFKDGADIIVRQRPGRTRCDNLVIQRGYTATDEPFDW